MTTMLYCFTGTGNCLVVARNIAAGLGDARVVRLCAQTSPDASGCDAIGFVAPVYHQGLPGMVATFIESVQLDADAYVFAVATYGDDNPGVFFDNVADALRTHGVALDACFGVPMPHNVHAMRAAERDRRLAAEPARSQQIADAVAARERPHLAANRLIAPLLKWTWRLANGEVADKGFTVDDGCIGCDICAYVCPADNIAMVDGRPQWALSGGCQECLACLQWCPRDAIHYDRKHVGRYHHPQVKVHDVFVRPRVAAVHAR